MTRPSALKNKSRKRRKPLGKQVNVPQPDNETTSESRYDDNGTISPISATTNKYELEPADATKAPVIGVEETKEEFATTWPAFIDKYATLGKKLPSLIVFIVIGVVILQDNNAGKITNWEETIWTAKKCGLIVVVYVLYIIVNWVCGFIKNN